MIIIDSHTKEAVAAYILFRRLDIDKNKIAIQAVSNGRGVAIIALGPNYKAIPVIEGPLVEASFSQVKGRWKEACKTIESKGWPEQKVQDLLMTSRVGKNAHKIIEALLIEEIIPPDVELTEKLYKREIVEVLGKDLVSIPLIKKPFPE